MAVQTAASNSITGSYLGHSVPFRPAVADYQAGPTATIEHLANGARVRRVPDKQAAGNSVYLNRPDATADAFDAGEGAKIKLGPPLNGLDGRAAGTYPGFNYSEANKSSGITWKDDTFHEYIKNPMQKIPGTRMAFAGVKDEKEVDTLWAYLKQFDAEGHKK